MVTQCPLEALFIVRVYAGQPDVACGVTVSTSPCGGDGEGSIPFKQPTVDLSSDNPDTLICNE
jgi:hypothetical protein